MALECGVQVRRVTRRLLKHHFESASITVARGLPVGDDRGTGRVCLGGARYTQLLYLGRHRVGLEGRAAELAE